MLLRDYSVVDPICPPLVPVSVNARVVIGPGANVAAA